MVSLEMLAAAALWVAAGMTFVSIPYRRGHDGWHWLVVGALAGPFTAAFLADEVRVAEPEETPTPLRQATDPAPAAVPQPASTEEAA
jgi:hypothetical protein